jgi:acyl-CoA dehydrogenase
MRLLLQVLIVTLFTGSIVQWRMPMRLWAPIFAGILILLGIFATPPWWFLCVVTLIYLSGVIVLAVPQIRHTLVTKPLLTRIQKILPPMSETERIALEAGDVWWEAQLFSGRPDWKRRKKKISWIMKLSRFVKC